MSVELVLGGAHDLHTGCLGMLHKCIHVIDPDGNGNRRITQRFSAEAASLGPLASDIDGRIADHKFGVRDTSANLKTECFFCPQSLLIKLNRFGRISERQSW